MLEAKATTLWTLRRKDGSAVECQMRFVPNGVEVAIVVDRQAVASRTFSAGHEALTWAEEERVERTKTNLYI